MNLEALQRKLLAVARANPPSDRVPYTFEKRIMARLAGPIACDPWLWWTRALWRAAATCLAIMVLSSAWTFGPKQSDRDSADFYQQFETAVFALADPLNEVE